MSEDVESHLPSQKMGAIGHRVSKFWQFAIDFGPRVLGPPIFRHHNVFFRLETSGRAAMIPLALIACLRLRSMTRKQRDMLTLVCHKNAAKCRKVVQQCALFFRPQKTLLDALQVIMLVTAMHPTVTSQ